MIKPKRIRTRLNSAHVLATVALFAAVGTGGAYAANTIGGADVVDESLTDADIKNGSLGAAIADGSIGAFKLAGNAVWGGQGGTLLDNSVSGYDVADDNLTDADVKDGSLNAAIAPGSIDSAKLATAAVQPGDIGADAVKGGYGGAVDDNTIDSHDVDESKLTRVPSAASAPVEGWVRVEAETAENSETYKGKGVACPAGKRVISVSGAIMGANNVAITQTYSYTSSNDGIDYAQVKAEEIEPTDWTWSVQIQAICAKVAP